MDEVSFFFFFTKKNPAPSGEEDRRINPAANKSRMYASIDSLSRCDKL